jgi:hypothetical protein
MKYSKTLFLSLFTAACITAFLSGALYEKEIGSVLYNSVKYKTTQHSVGYSHIAALNLMETQEYSC